MRGSLWFTASINVPTLSQWLAIVCVPRRFAILVVWSCHLLILSGDSCLPRFNRYGLETRRTCSLTGKRCEGEPLADDLADGQAESVSIGHGVVFGSPVIEAEHLLINVAL